MRNKSGKTSAWRIAGRIGVIILTTLLLVVLLLYLAMWMLVKGPSPTICRLFVNSVKETSAGGFLADLYLSEEEIAALRPTEDTVDTDDPYIETFYVPDPPETKPEDTHPADTSDVPPVDPPDGDGIEIVDVEGPTFYGKMMIVKDPKRVIVGVPDHFGNGYSGLKLDKMIEKYGAVGGINAGGFYDPNGSGTGSIPDGLVIYEGKLAWGNLDTSYWVAGLDKNGRLYANKMTARKALDLGIQYAASFGPALVLNGEIVTTNNSSYNPRTAIGQREDGAILLLVINGRSVSSLGATLVDTAGVMLDFGAVNATNLDGGSSSLMIYKGEDLTKSAYVFGTRALATAFIVK